jgi:hypothetical protein
MLPPGTDNGGTAMKLTALLLALPLALGSGAVLAESTTTTESRTSNPVGTTESSSTMERHDGGTGKTVEKRNSTRENPDGSVSTESSKRVTRPE